MSNYKYPTPQLLLKAICDTIRAKTGSNDKIAHQNIPDELDSIIIDEEEYKMAAQELLNVIYGEEMEILDSKYILSIPEKRFYYNNKITTVNLPECTSIGSCAFESCTSLTTVSLPECTSIGSGAFENCTSLTTIDLPECTVIDGGAHYTVATINCRNLTTVNLPKCTSIETYTFGGCTNLTTIDLPECTSIGYYAFYGCTNLTTVNLPKCTSIGDYAFVNCNLQIIILGADQVAHIGIEAFGHGAISAHTGYIYVPDNLVDSYKTAANWSTYANQIKPISSLPSNLKEEYGYD